MALSPTAVGFLKDSFQFKIMTNYKRQEVICHPKGTRAKLSTQESSLSFSPCHLSLNIKTF